MENKSIKPIRLLNQNFVLLWQGQLVSIIGDNAFSIAMMFWLMHKTGSASLMGLIMMVSTIPAVVLGPIAGVFADRYSRWKIIMFSDLFRGILTVGFAVFVFLLPDANDIVVSALIAVSIISSIIGSLFRPAIISSIPQIVPSEKLNKANSLNTISTELTNTIGRGIGGILFRILGAPLMFLFDGFSFIYSAASMIFVKIPQEFPDKKNISNKIPDFLHDIKDGLMFVINNRGLTYLVFLTTVGNFLITPFFVLLPFYVENILKANADWYGYLLAGLSVGMIMGAGIAGALKLTGLFRSNLFISAQLLFSLLFPLFGLIGDNKTAALIVILWGMSLGVMNTLIRTILQQTVPDWIRGRVFSVLGTISGGLYPIGLGLVGIIADLLNHNISPIFIICGLINIIGTLFFISRKQFQAFIAYDLPVKE